MKPAHDATPAESDIHNDSEIWKAIPAFPDYEASNLGRVRSLPRVRTDAGGRNGGIRNRNVPGVILRPALHKGYPHVALTVDAKGYTMPVHRLVLEAFVGPRPDGMECRHLDGNRTNANLDNLAWGTPSENQMDRAEHGTANIGEQHPMSKLTELDVIEILWRSEAGDTQTELAEMFDVSRKAIQLVTSRDRWQHVQPFRCTFCMDDDKLRIYSGYRFSDSVKDAIKEAGFRWAPKQECWYTVWSIKAEDLCLQISGSIEDEDISPEERAADRAERFAGYRDKRRHEAGYHADRFEAGPDAHGFQNPARAERAAARHDRQRDTALCQWSKAEYWQSRTAGVISHALHRSDAATRRGRILEIEKEIRRIEANYTPCPKTRHIMDTDCWSDDKNALHEKAWCGSGRGGHWVRVDRLDAIKASYARYIDHLNMRLIYENAMLANEGGKAADVEMVAGGWLGSHQIQKVNRSAVTGRVVSVALWGEETGYYKETGYKERTTRKVLRNINIERCGESVYRAPTPEELAEFNGTRKAKKDATPTIPTINPTKEDAQRLQDAWNAAALATGKTTKVVEIEEMTQAQFSRSLKHEYVFITEVTIGGQTIKMRLARGGGFYDYHAAKQVIVLTDKPQKALPTIPAPAPAEPITAGCLF